ncbi:hypothetical protein BHM03_00002677 [Ensete ventricosum]|nr:hypothetical protein BHM03_00002677 [Ensete ventricosum]
MAAFGWLGILYTVLVYPHIGHGLGCLWMAANGMSESRQWRAIAQCFPSSSGKQPFSLEEKLDQSGTAVAAREGGLWGLLVELHSTGVCSRTGVAMVQHGSKTLVRGKAKSESKSWWQ